MESKDNTCFNCGDLLAGTGKFCNCKCAEEYEENHATCDVCGHLLEADLCIPSCWGEKRPQPVIHPLKRRFPDYYQHSENWGGGMRLPNKKFKRAVLVVNRKIKANLLKRIAKGEVKTDDLPF